MNGLFSRDVQVRSLEQTVKQAEKHLGQVCYLLGSYTRKTAKLRDKADLLVSQIYNLSTTEEQEVQVGLRNLAEDLSMVQDYRQAQVERLESRVVSPLRAYGDIIRTKRAEVKKFSSDLSRELKELQKMEKIRLKNPADRQSISQADVNAQKASNNAQRCVRQMEETVTEFQRQKLEDIKRIFSDFVTVEMLFHAKALEIYSHTHHNLQNMDIDKDLELFTGRLRSPDHLSRCLDSSSPLSGHYPSPAVTPPKLQSLRSTLAPPTGHRHSQATARRCRTLERQRGIEEEEEEEEEDDEEEDQHIIRQPYAAQFTQMHRWQK